MQCYSRPQRTVFSTFFTASTSCPWISLLCNDMPWQQTRFFPNVPEHTCPSLLCSQNTLQFSQSLSLQQCVNELCGYIYLGARSYFLQLKGRVTCGKTNTQAERATAIEKSIMNETTVAACLNGVVNHWTVSHHYKHQRGPLATRRSASYKTPWERATHTYQAARSSLVLLAISILILWHCPLFMRLCFTDTSQVSVAFVLIDTMKGLWPLAAVVLMQS